MQWNMQRCSILELERVAIEMNADIVIAQETGIEDSNTVKQLRDHAQTEWGLSRPDIIISVLAGANGAESCISRDNREQILTGDSPVCSMHA